MDSNPVSKASPKAQPHGGVPRRDGTHCYLEEVLMVSVRGARPAFGSQRPTEHSAQVRTPPLVLSSCSSRSSSCGRTWHSRAWTWLRSRRRCCWPHRCAAGHTAAATWWRRWRLRASWRGCSPHQVSRRGPPTRVCTQLPRASLLAGPRTIAGAGRP